MRLLVIGLDGASYDLIHPLAQEGKLPNLTRLIKEGAWGTLRSTIPPISPAAWRTFLTGKNPGQHGVFDFQSWDYDYTQRPRPAQWHRHKTIYRLLSEANRQVISIDVPFSYPPEPVKGLLVTGYPTPRTPQTVFTHPADLPQYLRTKGFDLQLGWPETRIDVHPSFFKAWDETMAERERLLNYLITQESWDLFMVVFGITDTLSHTLWHYLDPQHPASHSAKAPLYRQALFRAYEQCDHALGKLWAHIEGQDVHLLVLSDHGFGSIRPRQWLFRFLQEHKWLHYSVPSGGGRYLAGLGGLAARVYTETAWLRRWIRELRPGSKQALRGILGKGGLLPESQAIDTTRSLTLPSDMGTHIYLNRKGRFRDGMLTDTEAKELAATIRAALLQACDTNDQRPIVRNVFLRDEVYQGEAVAQAPDLIIEYANRYIANVPTTGSTRALNPHLTGGHVMEGILLGWGPGIQSISLPDTDIVNLAPTMLHLLGQPIPPDMDGAVIADLFSPAWQQAHPVQLGDTAAIMESDEGGEYSAEEQAVVNEQLRALGYVE